MNAKENIKNNLRFLVKSGGFTRKQLAKEIGVLEKAFDAYLDGRTMPRIQTLIAIAERFNITVDDLVRAQLSAHYQFTQKILSKIPT